MFWDLYMCRNNLKVLFLNFCKWINKSSWCGDCIGQAWTAAFRLDLAAASMRRGLAAAPTGLVWQNKAKKRVKRYSLTVIYRRCKTNLKMHQNALFSFIFNSVFWMHCSELMGGWGWGSVINKSCSPQKKWRSKSVWPQRFLTWHKIAKIPTLGKQTHVRFKRCFYLPKWLLDCGQLLSSLIWF